MRARIYARRTKEHRRTLVRDGDRMLSTLAGDHGHRTVPAMSAGREGWRTADLLSVQRSAGNRIVGRLLADQRPVSQAVAEVAPRQVEQIVPVRPRRRERQGRVQRISIPRVATADPNWQMVPPAHRARVRAALAIINEKMRSRRLITYFRDNAPGGREDTLQQVANRAQVWELRQEGSLGMAVVGGKDMAYDTLIYRIGRWQIAATLLHEMGHLASFPTEEQCEQAIDAGRVYAPFIESVQPRQAAPGDEVTISGMSFGPRQESTDRVTIGGTDAGRAANWEWQHAGGEIRVRVPTDAESGPLVVENNRIPSNPIPFRVRAPENTSTG